MSDDRNRLNRAIANSIKKVFKDALSYIEMSDMDKNQFKQVRKMILRSGNDEIRKMSDELTKYDVKYTPRYDERIEFDYDRDSDK